MQTSDVTLVVTALVLQEFVHVITDARRFDPAAFVSEAIAIARGYLDRTNVECLTIDDRSCRAAFDFQERHRLGRRRMADCLLAATLLGHGVHRLATFNTRDFSLFAPLTAFEPVART
jgi:predicted nucleic acid-binding protein